MLLTKKQQKFITKILQQVSIDIRAEQDEENEIWAQSDHECMLKRGAHIGRQAAYEKCFHIAKTAAEKSYEAEYDGADQRLASIADKMDAQAKALRQVAGQINQPESNLILDQVSLLESFSRDIKLILRQI